MLFRYLLSLLSGALLVTAFAPLNFWPVALFVPAGLLHLLQKMNAKQAAISGFCFGLGLFGTGVWWVFISLNYYGQAPWLFAGLATALLVVYLAVYSALFSFLLVRYFPTHDIVKLVIVAPALWILLEWLRSIIFTGFPWLSIGYSQTSSPLFHFAPVGGLFLVGYFNWLISGLIAVAINRSFNYRYYVAVAVGITMILGTGMSLQYYTWTRSLGEPINVALIQGNMDALNRWRPNSLMDSLHRYAELSWRYTEERDLIIWPEMAIPALVNDLPEPFVREMLLDTQERRTDYLIGIADGSWSERVFYNAVMGFGEVTGQYRKRRLVVFGEYLPFRSVLNTLRRFVDIPMSDLSPGDAEQPLMTVRGLPIGVTICFDAVFGAETRLAMPDAAYLVTLSNDSWFGNSFAPHQHLQIAQMRAYELGRDLVRATNTGVSALINDRGQITDFTRLMEIAVLRGTVQPREGLTFYGLWGDGLTMNIMGLILLIAVIFRGKTQFQKLGFSRSHS